MTLHTEELLNKIPAYSSGRPKSERLREIQRMLETYTYSARELQFFEREINDFVAQFGHAGRYKPKR